MEFRDVKIGEFANVLSGYGFKSSEFTENGVPIIKIKNIRVGSIDLDDVQFVDESYLELDKKFHVRKGDLLISLTGSHLTQPNSVVGRVARYSGPHALLNQRAGKIIFEDENICDRKYLYYLLSTLVYKRKLALFASGAASQANISPSQVESLEVKLPNFDTQQKVASILSAFDDLIENNSRRIEILEEMARRIYREWFVHFCYPGHEDDKLVDSGTELGEIPERWEVKSFNEISEVLSGGTPKTKVNEYWDGDLPFFSPKDATDNFFVYNTSRTVSHKGVENCASELYPPKTIFITARGTVGKLNMPLVPMAMNQSCYALKAKEGLGQYFVFFSIENLVKSLQKKAHGAVFDTIIMDTFKQIYSIVPPLKLAKKFEKVVEPMLDQIQALLKKNERLKETRDLLLPKLISGKINVEEVSNQITTV